MNYGDPFLSNGGITNNMYIITWRIHFDTCKYYETQINFSFILCEHVKEINVSKYFHGVFDMLQNERLDSYWGKH